MHRFNKFWLGGYISERLANLADTDSQNSVRDCDIGPEGVEKRFLRDQLIRVVSQIAQ